MAERLVGTEKFDRRTALEFLSVRGKLERACLDYLVDWTVWQSKYHKALNAWFSIYSPGFKDWCVVPSIEELVEEDKRVHDVVDEKRNEVRGFTAKLKQAWWLIDSIQCAHWWINQFEQRRSLGSTYLDIMSDIEKQLVDTKETLTKSAAPFFLVNEVYWHIFDQERDFNHSYSPRCDSIRELHKLIVLR